MNNLLQRLLLFFLGVPAIVALIFFLPQLHHLAAVLVVIVFTGGCGLEIAGLFRARGVEASTTLFVAIGALVPLGAYLGGILSGGSFMAGACFGALVAAGLLLLASFVRFAFVAKGSVSDVIPEASALSFAIAYPGLLGAFVVLIASEPRFATESLLSFCLLSFSSDSLAWLFGMTLGRHRGIVAVSPNKSLEGFLAGLLAPVGMAFACAAFFPEAYGAKWWQLLSLGLALGISVIVGDLFESALKRSAGAKDSGSAVPGRGGFLDSFDGLLFSAPVFYCLSLLVGFFR
jgi:phosphatidate cytidylyltransferase